MRYFKKLVGENIYLSPINLEDYEKYTEWINDLDISLKLGNAHQIYTLQKEQEILEDISENSFAIILKENDKLIGNCGLIDVEQVTRKAELGIFIGEKEYWNMGYGTEAITLLLDYGFNLLNLHNIMLEVFAFNKRAIECYKKIGFKEIGRRREAREIAGKKYDEVFMDILATEFTEGKISLE
ncbi:MAG TPA: GNAT family protein [Halanaerobiales bacterium]|nr:GNAT family protein [Halanaerobiales bacterium]